MNFKIMAAALIAAFSAPVFAQETTVITEVIDEVPATSGSSLTSDFKSNWFISAGAGPQVFWGENDRDRKFGQRISPALDVAVGKWITPVVGFRVMYSGLYAKGCCENGIYSTGKQTDPGSKNWVSWLQDTKFNFMNLHVDAMFDLCNWIGGYNPKRPYSIAFYGGVGFGYVWDRPHQNTISGNVGLFNMFHISKAFDINLDLRLTGFHDGFDGQAGHRPFDALTSVTAGITYRFAPRGWKIKKEVVTVYDNGAVNDLRAKVRDLVAENEKLEKDIRAGKNVKHNVVEFVSGKYLIYFPINVSELNNADRAQLEMCAEAIKNAPKGTKFNIVGYADKATGSPEVNEILSRSRAENVRACLVKEFGISPERFVVTWRGGVGNMFYDDPALSRVVILSPVK